MDTMTSQDRDFYKKMYEDCYNKTVFGALERAVAENPDKEVMYDTEYRITYRELRDKAERLAQSLLQMGVKQGDRIAVSLPNWHEFVEIYFAIAKIGAVIVPMNTRYQAHEVEYILKNSGAEVVFCTESFGGVPHLQHFQQLKESALQDLKIVTVRHREPGYDHYDDIVQQGGERQVSEPTIRPEEDVFTILYTSGTTGTPKGAMLTHANVVHTGTITAEYMKCTRDDVFLVAVPVFHVFGMVPSILTAVAAKGSMVLMPEYKAEAALTLIEQEGITVHHGVPTMFILELNHPDFNKYDLSTLRTGIIAAAPCPAEVVKRIRLDMGCNIVVCYGSSETSATLTMTEFDDDDQLRSETVGKTLRGAEVKIVNDQRQEVAPGVVGEIACRSFGVMKGYYNMPEATREAMDEEGWFYSGDMGTMDEKGYVRIVGRKKEMIIRGGYNIYPTEIEDIFYQHPAVLEVAIVGLPDSVLGEISCAAITPKENVEVTEEELKTFIQGKVADYKVPDKVIFVSQIPKTASGKIKKVALREELLNDLREELK